MSSLSLQAAKLAAQVSAIDDTLRPGVSRNACVGKGKRGNFAA
jgi:hypothetical protein